MRQKHVHSWTSSLQSFREQIVASLALSPGHKKRQSAPLGIIPECMYVYVLYICVCIYSYTYVHTHTSLPFTDLAKGCSLPVT